MVIGNWFVNMFNWDLAGTGFLYLFCEMQKLVLSIILLGL